MKQANELKRCPWLKYPRNKPNEEGEYLIYAQMSKDLFKILDDIWNGTRWLKWGNHNITHFRNTLEPPIV